MKLIDMTLWTIALLLCSAVAFAPREKAPIAAPTGTTAPDASAGQERPPTGPAAMGLAPLDRGGVALDPEAVQRCLDVARDVDPALAESLERIRAERPQQAIARALADRQYLRSLAALKVEDPMLYSFRIDELRMEARIDHLLKELAEARRTSSPAAADLEAQLPALVEQQMGYSLLARGQYLRRLNEHIQSLWDRFSRDSGNFKQAVKDRVKELLDQVDRSDGDSPRH